VREKGRLYVKIPKFLKLISDALEKDYTISEQLLIPVNIPRETYELLREDTPANMVFWYYFDKVAEDSVAYKFKNYILQAPIIVTSYPAGELVSPRAIRNILFDRVLTAYRTLGWYGEVFNFYRGRAVFTEILAYIRSVYRYTVYSKDENRRRNYLRGAKTLLLAYYYDDTVERTIRFLEVLGEVHDRFGHLLDAPMLELTSRKHTCFMRETKMKALHGYDYYIKCENAYYLLHNLDVLDLLAMKMYIVQDKAMTGQVPSLEYGEAKKIFEKADELSNTTVMLPVVRNRALMEKIMEKMKERKGSVSDVFVVK